MMQRVDNPEQDISTTWRKFSEVWAVASRNSLYRILAISVALGARQRAKSSSQAPLYVLGWGGEGGDCYCELPRIPLPRTPVNRAAKAHSLCPASRIAALLFSHCSGSGRNHSETWAGCIVSLTTPTSSAFSASKSVSSLSLADKASRVFLASYFLL